jgi:bifunctional non-homologous end joining protein LigD
MVFYAFNLLFLEGFDLRKSPQFERKRLLKMLFDETKLQSPILYSEHMLTDGNEMFAASCNLGFEGIISKNAEAPYRSDRNEGWLKVKCVQKGKFPIIGFVKDPARRRGPLSGKERGQRTSIYGQGRHGLVPNRIEPDPEATRHRRQSEIEAYTTNQEAKGYMG